MAKSVRLGLTEAQLLFFRRWLSRVVARSGLPDFHYSKQVGVSTDWVSKVKAGRTNPTEDTLSKLSAHVGFDVLEFIRSSDGPNDSSMAPGEEDLAKQMQHSTNGSPPVQRRRRHTGGISLHIEDVTSGKAVLKFEAELPMEMAMRIMSEVQGHMINDSATEETAHDAS